ncbi:MAG TPA: serine hydrolase [Terriglobia bacterium]|nr:serine hydrolase [Terriglobia bacterium]
MNKILVIMLGMTLRSGTGLPQSAPMSSVPPDAEIRKILVERIDTFHQGVGIVVGVIEPQGRRVIAYGSLDKGDARPLNGDTIFEIGSATKVFTSLLLADMVQRGEVALTDPIAKYLPADVKVPQRGDRSITLVDLSTHTSGLPRMPSNFHPKDPANPYADYTVEQLYQFLSAYQLTRDIGSQFEYSNLGGGLLGNVLARRAGMDYEALVRSRITGPLNMTSTAITLSPEMKTRLAVGHNDQLKAVPNWDFQVLAGCGALRSSVNDLLAFLAANLGYAKTPLAPAMASMLTVRRPTGPPLMGEIGLAWIITKPSTDEIVWHNGGTYGYRSFVGFDLKTRVGVVVLSNTFTGAGVDDVGMHLLDSHVPLLAPKEHKEITVDPKILDGYVGRYQLASNFILTITREGNQLNAQATNQPKLPIFPEGERDFFYKIVDAQITFETDATGRATSLTLHQNGADVPAKRIEGEPAPAAPSDQHKEVAVDPKLFDGYVGQYQLAPNFIMTITREGDGLFAQATGQPKVQIFPQSDREYFYKVVDAQITFETDSNGRATSLALHQNGANMSAKRID